RSAHHYGTKSPLEVDVISTDWQWVFVYPKQHIATVDRLVIPVGTPVRFRLTSATVVNDFYIPQLVGMIDVMPGMRVKQSLVANDIGSYQGFSANYSGAGFSWMTFRTQSVSADAFRKWTQKVQGSQQHLTYAAFNTIAKPTINVDSKVAYFSNVQAGLFDHVITQVMGGKVYPTPMAMTENMTKYLQKKPVARN
ncbi:MAG: cytochrome ubiquinol oxidase subunit II, partial [Acidiferrobacter sp.]